MNQDSAFMSSLMNYLLKKYDIKIKTVAPNYHQLLHIEQSIKSLSSILTRYLITLDQMWPKYLPFATVSYNTFTSPNLANYSSYELVFCKKIKITFGARNKSRYSDV